jgi:D-glycero-D-manno-heptose 1,7-bisphosphate phosphatase
MFERAVFLDLNGTLVMPILVDHPNHLRPISGVGAAVARLSAAGFTCPVVTIQSRIAKGLFSMEQFLNWFESFSEELAEAGGRVVGPYVCPHRFKDRCECKKPSPFLYERAAKEHGLDLRRSFVIGDSAADVESAHRFGGRGCLVRTGYAEDDREVARAKPYAAVIADSFPDAVNWVLAQPDAAG